QGQVVGQTGVHRLIEADRGDTKAKEAGVTLGELDAQVVEPEEVRAQDLTELRMHETRRRPTNGENRLDAVVVQTFEQYACSHHARRSEQEDLHRHPTLQRCGAADAEYAFHGMQLQRRIAANLT